MFSLVLTIITSIIAGLYLLISIQRSSIIKAKEKQLLAVNNYKRYDYNKIISVIFLLVLIAFVIVFIFVKLDYAAFLALTTVVLLFGSEYVKGKTFRVIYISEKDFITNGECISFHRVIGSKNVRFDRFALTIMNREKNLLVPASIYKKIYSVKNSKQNN